jgi:hypothetical protein
VQKGQPLGEFLSKRRDLWGGGRAANALDADKAVMEALKTALLSLEGSRVYNLLEEYRQKHGRQAREAAFLTYHHWRAGQPVVWGSTASRLFALLPRHLSEDEKLSLLRCLRLEALERLTPIAVKLTLARPGDLAAVVSQILPLLRRIEAMDLPAEVPMQQRWLFGGDMPALARIAGEADRLLATRRLADLIVQLTTLFRLRVLAGPGTKIHVSAHFVIPTATVTIQFRDSFWKEKPMNDATDTDQDFLVRLQDLALTQEWHDGAMSYVDFVMRTLTPSEQEKLRAIAIAEGLRTEILLRELHVKTLAAKADIDLTLATTQNLKEQHYHGKVMSEHATASGTTRIEITLESCPLMSSLTRWRKPKRLAE